MKVTINEHEGRLVAALCGDFDNVASTQAESDLTPVFNCKDKDIVLDCTKLDYISSSGLRILLSIFKKARGFGHRVALRGLNENVREVLTLSGFLPLFIQE